MKILVIEDDIKLAEILKQGLEENGFAVDLSHDGEEGLQLAKTLLYDGVLLDIMLPGINGFAILDELRARGRDVPVLMITALGEVEDRIKGLNIGADDYITKPFDFSELVARLRSVIRRSGVKPSPLIEIDDLTINTTSRSVMRAGRKIKLSATEYGLLEYLALNKSRVVSRTELAERLYETEMSNQSNVIDVYISHLRNKVDRGYGRGFGKRIIRTIRGVGYTLKGDR